MGLHTRGVENMWYLCCFV